MNSSRSNSRRTALCGIAAGLLLCAGCVYSRIVPDGGYGTHAGGEGETLRVLEMELVTDAETALGPVERNRSKESSLGTLPEQLQKVCPNRFSDRPEAIPILVRLRCTVTEEFGVGTEGPLEFFALASMELPAALTLFTIPARSGCLLRLDASIQLGPGKWSDGAPVSAKKESLTFNPLGNFLFGWMLSDKNGWHMEENDAVGSDGIELAGSGFSLISCLEGSRGTNRRLAETIAALVADAWDDLNPGEKAEARRNPVAKKRFAELFPFEADRAGMPGGTVPVLVPAPPKKTAGAGPQVVRKEYDPSTRRGVVVFAANGTEHLRAMEWVRTRVLPSLVGKNARVRILSEGMEGDGAFRIEFEKTE